LSSISCLGKKNIGSKITAEQNLIILQDTWVLLVRVQLITQTRSFLLWSGFLSDGTFGFVLQSLMLGQISHFDNQPY
jgi:hypothetical protein